MIKQKPDKFRIHQTPKERADVAHKDFFLSCNKRRKILDDLKQKDLNLKLMMIRKRPLINFLAKNNTVE